MIAVSWCFPPTSHRKAFLAGCDADGTTKSSPPVSWEAQGMGVCGAWYLSECTEITCCESYRFRLYILLFSVLCVLAALLVGATWLLLEFRPSYRNRIRRTDSEQARIEMKSFEETRYLRRFSELK
ncbi:hypothetical protein Y032_0032g2491 [Ancylostoma ceylanicum]|uniref:Uncharacterized protein n=2 Tax=Ancylostoma ceylanicum TaxID=53326 RepID=A0A016UPH6_9BILA|nr:hypothetical protein Y032_0032g2491 [Ancylostoma ceylanicum]